MTIKEIRKAACMTQSAFAAYIGIGKRTLEGWECKHPCPEYIRALIEYKMKMEGIIVETVKIYTIDQTQGIMMCETGTRFSLEPWGESTENIIGSDNGGIDYILPAGYTVREDTTGVKHIYTSKGEYCPLIAYGHTPAIIDDSKPLGASQIMLKKAE